MDSHVTRVTNYSSVTDEFFDTEALLSQAKQAVVVVDYALDLSVALPGSEQTNNRRVAIAMGWQNLVLSDGRVTTQ